MGNKKLAWQKIGKQTEQDSTCLLIRNNAQTRIFKHEIRKPVLAIRDYELKHKYWHFFNKILYDTQIYDS